MRSTIIALLLAASTTEAHAQLFMRAFAPEEATFDPPNYNTLSSDAALRPSGYLLAQLDGIVCDIDHVGEPIGCFRLRRQSALPDNVGVYVDDVAAAGNDVFYHSVVSADTLAVIRSDGASNIIWQAAVPGPTQMAQVLPTGDGGCAVLTTFGPSQRAAVARYNPQGVMQWRKTYRVAGNNTLFRARSMAHTGDDGFLLCGMMTVDAATSAFILRLDPSGNVNWANAIATGNNVSAEGRAVTELTGGNIRVAVVSPQAGMPLGMIDLSAAGTLVASWGYSGATFNVGRIHFGPDGSAYGTAHLGDKVFRLAPDGTPVFAVTHAGPADTYMSCKALLPKSDGTQVMLGSYGTNPYQVSNSITVLYACGPSGELPTPFSAPYSFTTAAYTPTLSPITSTDSTLTAQLSVQLTFESIDLWKDTVFGSPTSVVDRPFDPFDLRLKPNPAIDRLTIETEDQLELRSVLVLDVSGARVLSLQGNLPAPCTIDLGPLSSGAYILQVESARGRVSRSFLKN